MTWKYIIRGIHLGHWVQKQANMVTLPIEALDEKSEEKLDNEVEGRWDEEWGDRTKTEHQGINDTDTEGSEEDTDAEPLWICHCTQNTHSFFVLFLIMAIIIYVSFVKAVAGVFSSWWGIQQPLSIIETNIIFLLYLKWLILFCRNRCVGDSKSVAFNSL